MKKNLLPIISVSLLMASCSAAYKTGQTPDDVYYSSNAAVERAIVEEDASQEPYYSDDAYLRMKVRNQGKWNTIEDNDYWYGGYNSNVGYYNGYNAFSPYNNYGYNRFSYGISYANPWYSSWNYNPWGFNNWGYYPGYYTPVVIVGGKYPRYTNSSRPGLSGYSNNNYYRGSNTGGKRSTQYSKQYQSIFENKNNSRSSNSSTYEAPTRTFNSGGSGSSGGSSSGSSRSSGSSSGSGRGGRGG